MNKQLKNLLFVLFLVGQNQILKAIDVTTYKQTNENIKISNNAPIRIRQEWPKTDVELKATLQLLMPLAETFGAINSLNYVIANNLKTNALFSADLQSQITQTYSKLRTTIHSIITFYNFLKLSTATNIWLIPGDTNFLEKTLLMAREWDENKINNAKQLLEKVNKIIQSSNLDISVQAFPAQTQQINIVKTTYKNPNDPNSHLVTTSTYTLGNVFNEI